MQTPEIISAGPYKIGFTCDLSAVQVEHILHFVQLPPDENPAALEGRQKVNVAALKDYGEIAVKHYARGGLIRHLIKNRYIKWGKTRAEAEFRWLHCVRDLGVCAPLPVAFVWSGRVFYRCWLILDAIRGHQTMAALSSPEQYNLKSRVMALVDQVCILIENQILHVDLHPGNVLITPDNGVHIIDFDKAKMFRGRKTDLRDRYISRWCRALAKHHLPPALGQWFKDGLMKKIPGV